MLKLGTVIESNWNHSYAEMKAKQCNGLGLHTVEKRSPVHNFRCLKGLFVFDLCHRLTTNYDLPPLARHPTSVVMHLKM